MEKMSNVRNNTHKKDKKKNAQIYIAVIKNVSCQSRVVLKTFDKTTNKTNINRMRSKMRKNDIVQKVCNLAKLLETGK